MPDVIDSLSIQIGASVDKPLSSIDKVTQHLENLKTSLGGLQTDDSYLKALDGLSNGFASLAVGINSADSDKFKTAANGLKSIITQANKISSTAGTGMASLSKSLKDIGEISTPNFSQINVLGNAIKKIGSGGESAVKVLPAVTDAVKEMSESFTGTTFPDFTQIGVFGNAIAKLGGKNSAEAIKNIPQISNTIRQMVEDLNDLPEVNEKTQDLVIAFGNLAKANTTAKKEMSSVASYSTKTVSAFGKLKAAVAVTAIAVKNQLVNSFKQGYNSAQTFGKGLNHVQKRSESLVGAIIKVRTIIWAIRNAFNAVSESIGNASSLVEVQNVIENVYDASYIEEFNNAAQSAINTLGMSQLSFSQYASRYQAMGKALGITNSQMSDAETRLKSMGVEYGVATGKMGDMSVNITKLAGDMASFYDVAQEDVYQDLQAIFTGQTRPLNVAA